MLKITSRGKTITDFVIPHVIRLNIDFATPAVLSSRENGAKHTTAPNEANNWKSSANGQQQMHRADADTTQFSTYRDEIDVNRFGIFLMRDTHDIFFLSFSFFPFRLEAPRDLFEIN